MDDIQQESPDFAGSLPDDLFNDPASALPATSDPASILKIAKKLDELSLNSSTQ